MVQIANFRQDEFGDNAAAFLRSVNAFDMLMLAMCADAADEMLLSIRFHDNESADVATITQKVDECVTNLGCACDWGGARGGCLPKALEIQARGAN
eukprot:9502629-Pyramimonas_sp.AAC.1